MVNYHTISAKEALSRLKTPESGLSSKEAEERLKKHGYNELKKIKRKTKFALFLEQFKSLLIWILIAAAIISYFIGNIIDVTVILAIVVINAFIGFVQEYKAEEIIEKLKKTLQYTILVLRDGRQQEIPSKFLVPGDIILLEEGDKVLTDCRIISKINLQTNEAVLTGESFPIEKFVETLPADTPLAERKNMLYAGTSVVKGKSKAIIVNTGLNTEFGKLAELVQTTKDEIMPLEQKINDFSKKISMIITAFVIVVFFTGLYVGIERMEMLLVSISLAVGAIPEGLPAIIAITLAIAIRQMYKVNTLIRKLPAAETLGRATVICTDKTGTLTKEELEVDQIFTSNKLYSIKEAKKKPTPDIMATLKIGILCNNARDEKDKFLGDPTEIALIKSGKLLKLDKKKETEENLRMKEHPFTSERKMMSIIRQKGNIKTSYAKGSPEEILKRCTKELIGGKIKLLSKKRKLELEKAYQQMASSGLRVLGFAFRNLTKISQNQAENHLIFTGFQGMIDNPRPEVKKAIQQAIKGGIKIKVITGDNALTTKAIADKIGLKGEIIEGKELDKLTESQWNDVVKNKTIFARVNPKQKLKIVEILKKQNETVAVTGDGVNDILALKKADIGIAMGRRGADVSRDSSDMVLLDDNFASIVKAVRQGRRVFDNIKKSIKFLLTANVDSTLVVLIALLVGLPLPFLPLAILWMNLVTDSLPALALAVEPAEKDIMEKPKKGGLLTGIWLFILVGGFIGFLSSIGIFYYSLNFFGIETARTMAISTAIIFELFFVFTCKTDKSLFKTGILNNKYLIYAFIASFLIHIVALYTPLSKAFLFTPLTLVQFGIVIAASLSGLILFEIWKLIKLLRR